MRTTTDIQNEVENIIDHDCLYDGSKLRHLVEYIEKVEDDAYEEGKEATSLEDFDESDVLWHIQCKYGVDPQEILPKDLAEREKLLIFMAVKDKFSLEELQNRLR